MQRDETLEALYENILRKSDSHKIFFPTLGQVIDEIRNKATQLGFEIDEDFIFNRLSTGGISYETTKQENIPLLKNGERLLDKRGKELNRYLHVSIYRMNNGTYELTMYPTF